MTKTNKIVTAVVVLLVIVLCGGLLTVLFVHKDKTDVKPAEIQYNATFGEKFKEEGWDGSEHFVKFPTLRNLTGT